MTTGQLECQHLESVWTRLHKHTFMEKPPSTSKVMLKCKQPWRRRPVRDVVGLEEPQTV